MTDFEEWYKAYPKKRGVGDARKAWNQTAKVRPPLEVMLKTLAVQKTSNDWLKDGGQFIPYPATYLRREQWADVEEVELEQVHNGKLWWQTVGGIQKKAQELGLGEWDPRVDPTWQAYVSRLRKIVDGKNVVRLRVAGD